MSAVSGGGLLNFRLGAIKSMPGYFSHCVTVLLLKGCSLSLATTYENSPFRPGRYRIKQSDKNEISNLANLTMAILPGFQRSSTVYLDFQHNNGTHYHVGPVAPSRSEGSTQRKLGWDMLEDDFKQRCWGLGRSRAVPQYEGKETGGELSTRTPYAQMKDVSRAFTSHLVASTLGNTLICSSKGEEQVLYIGFATEAFRRSRGGHTKSEFLFVAMEPVEDDGQLNLNRGDVVPSASGAGYKKFPDRCGLYRIDPDEKQKIKDLDDLTMDISPTPPRIRRKAQHIYLRFAHINGTESRVGPILTTNVVHNFERVWLSRSEDDLKGSCWGLQASKSVLPHKRKKTVDGEPPSPSPSLQMKSVSRVYSSNLSSATLGTTLLCLNDDVSLRLGFRAEPPTKFGDPLSKSHFLFVIMRRVEGGSSVIATDEPGKEVVDSAIGDKVESGAMQVDSVNVKRKADSESAEAEGDEVSEWNHLPPKKRYFKTNK
ncbi:hypothetical protein FOZ61_002744 [Perkinsus olseni]|uniref:Uncharacterized protein n=1 Tax=Perkinsus olseni TaxID=32597 RepID=A0A7J6LTD8_PEROL|nr:hypothetical protein FOZ61_002744 [Perkinsus olseni]